MGWEGGTGGSSAALAAPVPCDVGIVQSGLNREASIKCCNAGHLSRSARHSFAPCASNGTTCATLRAADGAVDAREPNAHSRAFVFNAFTGGPMNALDLAPFLACPAA